MSDKIVTVGIWESAPFKRALYKGIDRVNEFLKQENLDLSYESVSLNVEKLPKASALPDILFLDGGEDVNPSRYGETNRYSHFSEARDKAEYTLIDHFYNYGKKMSGVCRGHQILNVYFGGSLYQDIYNDGVMNHKYLEGHHGGHKVKLRRIAKYPGYYKEMSRKQQRVVKKEVTSNKRKHVLGRFIGANPFTVSSMHHQSVKNLGSNLGISLVFGDTRNAPHYIIEGIESSDGLVRGIQSHPEFNGYPKDGVMFSYLLHVDDFVDGIIEPDISAVEARLKIKNQKTEMPFDTTIMAHSERRDGGRTRLRANSTGRIVAESPYMDDTPVLGINTAPSTMEEEYPPEFLEDMAEEFRIAGEAEGDSASPPDTLEELDDV